VICSRCGALLVPEESTVIICDACGAHHHVLRAGLAEYRLEGQPIGSVVEGPHDRPEGRGVDSRPASGGQSESCTDADGFYRAKLSGKLDCGKPAQPHVLEILIDALRGAGNDVHALPGARDDRGEDGLLSIDGHEVIVQAVTVPTDPQVWKHLADEGTSTFAGDLEQCVRMIREALEKKRNKAEGTLLALDASQVGAIVGPRLVGAYRTVHRDPVVEFRFREVWIVGPGVRSAVRLSGSLDGNQRVDAETREG
jgi:hypothetical protein